ncbi:MULTISPECIES: oligopeptide/dipeptide ABC transporter ATP-binding protein [Sporomusa]|uniref:ABC transporter ATP-binding protein n=1 Tax=Sporomusa TaxID=2375 RepID=UPI003158AB73
MSNLKKYYTVRDCFFAKRKILTAVDNVSLAVGRRETLGIVGESGCGKSTLARCLVSLEKTTSGQIQFDGVELTTAGREELRQLRRNLQIVFQDPYAALNPLRTVGESIIEPLLNYHPGDSRELEEKAEQLLTVVGLKPEYKNRYPHQFSGGQLQRVNIARALALKPALVVCDEAVSNLDSIVKTQIVDLLLRLQDEFNMSYIFITHDLHVVRRIADRVAVMLGGKIVEVLPAGELAAAIHPYTRYLLSATLSGDPCKRRQRQKGTQPAGPAGRYGTAMSGCALQHRCPELCEQCRVEEPLLKTIGSIHQVACHLNG